MAASPEAPLGFIAVPIHDEDEPANLSLLEGGAVEDGASVRARALSRCARARFAAPLGFLLLAVFSLVAVFRRDVVVPGESSAGEFLLPAEIEDVIVLPEVAERLERARPKLIVERDLGTFVAPLLPYSHDVAPAHADAEHCVSAAEVLFEAVAETSGLSAELDPDELRAFKGRFADSMEYHCKHDTGFSGKKWLREAEFAIEHEKPIMTKKLAASLSGAGLGFEVKMKRWMVNESHKAYGVRLGRTALPPGKAVTREPQGGIFLISMDGWPKEFDSRSNWPECKEVIGRVHNQGVCGSCWVFAALGALDGRLCIKTLEMQKEKPETILYTGESSQLSRGYATSCSANEGRPGNGCLGGWEYFVYDHMEKEEYPGLVSERCSPYFAYGEGVDHFKQTMSAPACPSECQLAYPRSIDRDGFRLRGVGEFHQFHKRGDGPYDPHFIMRAKQAIVLHGPITFGVHAGSAFMGYSSGIFNADCGRDGNHAVAMIGYGQHYVLGMNSWGPDWGIEGTFKLTPCGVTDFTIPGDFDLPQVAAQAGPRPGTSGGNQDSEQSAYPFPLPDFEPNPQPEQEGGAGAATARPRAPRKGPCQPDPITGCVTSPNFPEDYALDMSCTIPKDLGRGKPIRLLVEQFDTEVGFDFLEVNQEAYSGLDSPTGVVPTTDMLWVSDDDVAGKGWKICPEEV